MGREALPTCALDNAGQLGAMVVKWWCHAGMQLLMTEYACLQNLTETHDFVASSWELSRFWHDFRAE